MYAFFGRDGYFMAIEPKPVRIHNSLAVAKYSMNASEQKLFIFALRSLNQDDENFVESKFNLSDFAEYSGLELTRLYKDIDEMTDRIMQTIIYVHNEEKDKWIKYNLTQKCSYDRGIVAFRFNDDMKPFLLQLKKHYFLQSPAVMHFRSWYSIRIYDLLKAMSYSRSEIDITIKELKTILNIEGKYNRISSFKARVVDVAVEEINKYSDLRVTYENIYLGRKVDGLKFIVYRNDRKNISLLSTIFDVNLIREKVGFDKYTFSDSQIEELYSIAVEKYTTYNDMDDILLYMKMCYEYTKKMQPENEYVYYKKVLANDYENFIAQINTGYFIDKL